MVKYKLIKEYPKSPRLGTIIQKMGWGETWSWIEDNPGISKEFWEEINEQYEVLSYECLNGDGSSYAYRQIFKKTCKGLYKWSNISYSEEDINKGLHSGNEGGYVIHSIKRLSDNVVFTVGDLVEHFKDARDKGIIEKFRVGVDNEIMIVHFRGKNYHTSNDNNFLYSNDFRVLQHSKQEPLFVTEDGKEIFEGDSVYQVSPANNYEIWNYNRWLGYFSDAGKPGEGKLMFSTEEAAERWIDKNKPKYSKRDILGITSKCFKSSIIGGYVMVDYYGLQEYLENDKTK